MQAPAPMQPQGVPAYSPAPMTQPQGYQPAPMQPQGYQPAPVSTTQQVAPPFQGKFALFLNTKNPQSKAAYSGKLSFNAEFIRDLVAYLQTHQPDERGNVNLFMVGFNNQAKSGTAYIGGYVSAEQVRGPAVQYGQQQVVPAPMAIPSQHQPAPAPEAFMQATAQQPQGAMQQPQGAMQQPQGANAWVAPPAQAVAGGDLSNPPF